MSRIIQKFWSYIQLARLDKPIGIWLVFFPTVWSLIWVSTNCYTFFQHISWLFLGAVCARSVGCIINDRWDRNFDIQVKRTAHRPLAAGQISELEFWLLLLFFGGCSLGILMRFNSSTVWLGLGVIPLIVIYPLMKRWTYWPQLFLALTFNWGALMSSAAVMGRISGGSMLIYILCAFWTVAYDTIYAHQDAKEDISIGIKSTALRFGKDTQFYIAGFATIFFLGLMVLWILKPYGKLSALGILSSWMYFFWGLVQWNPNDNFSSRTFFLRQSVIGWNITLFIILPLLWAC